MSRNPPSTPLFAQHPRNWRENTYIYPVLSRRSKGLSVGINLNTDKSCNFNCVYCCVDRSNVVCRAQTDLGVLRQELDDMLELVKNGNIWRMPPFDQTPPELRRFNDVAFSGDGEPTASAVFGPACRVAAELLARHHFTKAKIVLITNATLLDRPSVQETLQLLDRSNGEIWAKLDAGNEEQYRRIVRSPIPFQHVLDNIALVGRGRDIVIQSMFLAFDGQPPSPEDLADYVRQLRNLSAGGCRIRLVQAYTIARPVFQTHIAPLTHAQLDHIVSLVQHDGLAAEAYYAGIAE